MDNKPSKFWAYIAMIVGILLTPMGLAALIGYFGLPIFLPIEDPLTHNLGQIAAIFLGLVCGPLAAYHGIRSINNLRSGPLKLPSFYAFLIGLALVLALGMLVIHFEVASEYLFPPLFMLGASLSTLAVLAWAYRRLGAPISWRQASLSFVCGSTLSLLVALLLETILPYLGYLLLSPFWWLGEIFADLAWGTPGLIERIFASPAILVFLAVVALQAPIPEEFAKALGIPMFSRARIRNERQAFAVGLAAGAGFAILENMLYEGLYANYNGWGWAGITLLRSFGSVLHPLGTGIVALGWFRMKDGGTGKLFKAYLLSVGLHTLWNGGFEPLVYLTGLDYFAGDGPSLSLYGETLSTLLVGYLLLLSAGLWLLLRQITNQISERVAPDLGPAAFSRRSLATWAVACALVIVPIGATLSPAWNAIQSLIIHGAIGQVETPQIGTSTEAKLAYKKGISNLRKLARVRPYPDEIRQPGKVYKYETILQESQPTLWSYRWCATTQERLAQNVEDIELKFLLNETTITPDKLTVIDFELDNVYCRETYVLINTWPRGRFQLEIRVTFLETIRDGMYLHPPGTHYLRYRVTVKR